MIKIVLALLFSISVLATTIKPVGDSINSSDYSEIDQTVISGPSSNGDGSYNKVKVTPDGAIKIDGSIAVSMAPGSGGLTDTELRASPVNVAGTVACSNCSGGGTAGTVAISSLPAISGTVTVSNPQTSVSVTGVVTTNGTTAISGPVNTFGTTTIAGGTVSIAGVIPTTGTIQIATGSNTIGAISNTSFGVSGVVTTVGTQSISGVVNVNGTMALSANAATASNQTLELATLGSLATSANQTTANSSLSSIDGKITAVNTGAVIVASSALPSGAATSAKQDTLLATAGSISNAVTNGTLNVLARSEILYGSLAVTAGALGTLEIDTSNGYSSLRIFNDQSDNTGTDISWYASKTGGAPWESLACFNIDALDGQFLYSTGYWLTAGFPIDDFACDISTYKRIRIIAQAGAANLVLQVGAGKQSNTIFGIGSTSFNVDYQWRTVGGDGITPGPDGNAPTAANSKPIIQATDAIPFKVQGTVACSNCTGSSSGTTAVSGTVSVSIVGTGTMQIATGANTIGAISNSSFNVGNFPAIQPISGSVSLATTGTMQIATGSNVIGSISNSSFNVGNFPAIQPISGSVALSTTGTMQIATGSNVIGSISNNSFGVTNGTLSTVQSGTLNVVSAVTAITNALPAGTNLLGKVGIDQTTPGTTNKVSIGTDGVLAAGTARIGSVRLVDSADADLTAAKGSQTSRFIGVQNATDSGRTAVNYYFDATASGSTGTETMITLTKSFGTLATSSGTSFVVTSGKTFRINDMWFASRGNVTATAQVSKCSLRFQRGTVGAASTPVLIAASTATPATALAWDRTINLVGGDGFEIAGDGTVQFGLSCAATFTTNAPTWYGAISGYEY